MAMRPGKAGVSLPGTIADVVDDKGKPVPPGVGGRLVLKHPYPCMLRTVWRNPARYERDWQQIPGCYVTGDVALKDKDGYITPVLDGVGAGKDGDVALLFFLNDNPPKI